MTGLLGRSRLTLAFLILSLVFSASIGVISTSYYIDQYKELDVFLAEQLGAHQAYSLTQEIISLSSIAKTKNEFEVLNTKKLALRDLLEKSNLILDPDFSTYRLVESIYFWLPLFYHGENVNTFEMSLGSKWTALKYLKVNLDRAVNGLEGSLATQLRESAGRFSQNAEAILRSAKKDGFHLNDLAAEAGSILNIGNQLFLSLNKDRMDKIRFRMTASMAASIVLWAISIVYAIVFALSVLRSTREAQKLIVLQKEALENAQKLATLGEVAAGIGHEIRNPLNVISIAAENLEDLFAESEPHITFTQRISRMVSRINSIITSVQMLSRPESQIEKTPVRLLDICDEVALIMKARLVSKNVELRIGPFQEDYIIHADEAQLVQILVILINNSVDALENAEEGGKNWVKVSAFETGNYFSVHVEDSGPGVHPDYREKIFDTFFTSKIGRGTGLGLSLARDIMNKHGGKLSLLDRAGGACFEALFPIEI